MAMKIIKGSAFDAVVNFVIGQPRSGYIERIADCKFSRIFQDVSS